MTEHLPPLRCVFHPGSLDRHLKKKQSFFSFNMNNPFSLALAPAGLNTHTCRRALSTAQLKLSAVAFQRGRLGSLLLFQFPCREQ